MCVYYLVMYCSMVTWILFRMQNSNLNVLFFHVLTESFVWKRVLTTGIPPSARDSHTCSSWKNKIIVIGGEDASDYYLSDVHVLDTGDIFFLQRFINFTGKINFGIFLF